MLLSRVVLLGFGTAQGGHKDLKGNLGWCRGVVEGARGATLGPLNSWGWRKVGGSIGLYNVRSHKIDLS